MRTFLIWLLLFPTLALAKDFYWLTPDVLVTKQNHLQKAAAVAAKSCREKIEQAVCLVDPAQEGVNPNSRPCLDGSARYARPFQELYDRFPAHLQGMFCHLDRIFIEKKFEATAYATLFTDDNDKLIAGGIGIRQVFLDQHIGLKHWASWKEQLNFGANPISYEVNPVLPTVHPSMRGFQNFLYFVVAHEFGHLFDIANHLNRYDDCTIKDGQISGTCVAAPGSWTALSWKSIHSDPIDGNDFPLRKSLCFYDCNGKVLAESQAGELYSDLFATNYISIYAAQNMMEDFADTHAYYTVQKYFHPSYVLKLQNGQNFDFIKRLESAQMKPKTDFIKAFLSGEFKYPGT